MTATLRSLANLINHSVDVIEARCTHLGAELPDPEVPSTRESEAVFADPDVADAVALISNAAAQIALIARPAISSVIIQALSGFNSAALRVASEFHVSDILYQAGPTGLHIDEIAKQSRTDAKKLTRILRFLASQGIFKEVMPDVYANNRLSSILQKGQTAENLFANPDKAYDGPKSATGALIGHFTDEVAKAAPYLYESLLDPSTASSDEPTHCALQRAFAVDVPLWEFLESPGNEHRLKRFGVAMEGAARANPTDILLKGFDWSSLPHGSTFVDVGGGIGTTSMAVAEAHPELNIVIQDRPHVVAEGLKHWEHRKSEAISSGRVSFQAHDFFDTQPIRGASIYFMKAIIHDWSDSYAARILARLKDAAQPHTRLLVMDRIIPYTCRVPDGDELSVPGLVRSFAPEPLLPSAGTTGPSPFYLDLVMMTLINGQERTTAHMATLFLTCGWKIVRVYQLNGFGHPASLLEAIPV